MDFDRAEKTIYLAQKIMNTAQDDLLLRLRFLDFSVGLLRVRVAKTESITTNGDEIGYNPRYILYQYREASENVTRAYLHVILHCIFMHPYVNSLIECELWNLACDIAVETIINELNLASTQCVYDDEQRCYVSTLQKDIKTLTAERIYRHLLDASLPTSEITRLHTLFSRDNHEPWYCSPERSSQNGCSGDGNDDTTAMCDGKNENGDSSSNITGQSPNNESKNDIRPVAAPNNANIAKWLEQSRQIKVDMETFSQQQGVGAGTMIQNLREVTREKFNYTSFLRRFSVLGEAMRINDEEFDYIFYTYGLRLYKKMPLIEPLEYKEVKQIKEFVVAIDTSGSVEGHTVQSFIQKTYNILKTTESFLTKIALYIIQCDETIQEAVKITSQEECTQYIKHMKLKGFGGTDFRPVFSYVEKLRSEGELTKLKGLIYFTDGYGVFPDVKPNYQVAFVFVPNGDDPPFIPPWAIKFILEESETK